MLSEVKDIDSASASNSDRDAIKAQKYEEKQQNQINSMVIGANDSNGNKIKKIYARGDEYVIYEIDDTPSIESLKVFIYTKIEENDKPAENYQQIKDTLDKIKGIIYRTNSHSGYRQRIASAIVTAISGKIEDARSALNNIESDALSDYKHNIYGRLYYSLGSASITGLLTIASILCYFFRKEQLITDNIHLATLIFCITYSSLGGFLSISLKAKEVFTQRAISYWMYIYYGAERATISIISGAISFTLISSGMVFPELASAKSSLPALLSICFLSGFSETLIPNAMNKLEKKNPK